MNKDKFPAAKQNKAHAARVRLFQILCAIDSSGENLPLPELVERLRELFTASSSDREDWDGGTEENSSEDQPSAGILQNLDSLGKSCAAACSVRENLAEIDSLITDNMTGWTIDRLSVVDRTIIRLAVYECMIAHTVNVKVALSEAVLLAQEFGSEESPRFVNGVLARIVNAAAENDQKS
ncbi:MAG: transcription antitermination factor NusB [Pyramidobacter sp.]|jgi:transcription antitermination factor NusB